MIRLASLIGSCCLLASPVAAQTRADLIAPTDPGYQARAPRYAPVTAGVKRFRVVEPKDWRELNRAVGPQSGGESAATTPAARAGRKR